MYKKMLSLLLTFTIGSLSAQSGRPESLNDNNELKTTIGLSLFSSKSPFKGVGSEFNAVPMLGLEYKDFYIKGGEIRYSLFALGYRFMNTEKLTLSAFINPFAGFKVDNDELRNGYDQIDSRDYQVEAGLKLQYNPDLWGIRANLYGVYGEEGGHWGASLQKGWKLSDKNFLSGRLMFTQFTGNYSNYYFGVSEAEAARNFAIDEAYHVHDSQSFGFDLTLRHKLTDDLSLLIFAGLEQMSNEVTDSPIVENGLLHRLGIGLFYRF